MSLTPVTVPTGWKLVPIEPTRDMKMAGGRAAKACKTIEFNVGGGIASLGNGFKADRRADIFDKALAAYRAMLDAAPLPDGVGTCDGRPELRQPPMAGKEGQP